MQASDISRDHFKDTRPEDDSDEWGTPPDLIDRLISGLDHERFALDPASGAEPKPIADIRYTKEDNGLAQSWLVDGPIFLNPPYSDPYVWIERLANAVNPKQANHPDFGMAILRLDTSTAWFHEQATKATLLAFPDDRAEFYRPPEYGDTDDPKFAIFFALFGNPPRGIIEELASDCAFYTKVAGTESFDPQHHISDFIEDGGVTLETALEQSPHWRKKPCGGYPSDTTWYLDRDQSTMINSPHEQTKTRPSIGGSDD